MRTCSLQVDIIDLDTNHGFALFVKRVLGCGCIITGFESVVHLQRTAAKAHTVARVITIVVIVVVLVRAYAELIGASLLEDRMPKQVVDCTRRVLAIKLDSTALVDDTGHADVLFAHAVLHHAVHHLLQSYLHGVPVYTVKACVIGSMSAERVGVEDRERCIRQVEGGHTCLYIQQGGVARGGGLHHFVFHGEEIHRILTRADVGADDDTLLLIDGQRAIHRKMQGILRQVVGVMNNMGGVVAIELEHQLQVVAQVILTKSQCGW